MRVPNLLSLCLVICSISFLVHAENWWESSKNVELFLSGLKNRHISILIFPEDHLIPFTQLPKSVSFFRAFRNHIAYILAEDVSGFSYDIDRFDYRNFLPETIASQLENTIPCKTFGKLFHTGTRSRFRQLLSQAEIDDDLILVSAGMAHFLNFESYSHSMLVNNGVVATKNRHQVNSGKHEMITCGTDFFASSSLELLDPSIIHDFATNFLIFDPFNISHQLGKIKKPTLLRQYAEKSNPSLKGVLPCNNVAIYGRLFSSTIESSRQGTK